ncbi:hypothetical protein P8452_45427 [Trifolium repens]|nr:hypothetical protein P8452_45427 [Trifolium repens]
MQSEAFMGVSAAVHFHSLLFSVTNSLITIASLHHHRNPLFSTKNGQNQFQVLSISPSHHLINPLFSISILVLKWASQPQSLIDTSQIPIQDSKRESGVVGAVYTECSQEISYCLCTVAAEENPTITVAEGKKPVVVPTEFAINHHAGRQHDEGARGY